MDFFKYGTPDPEWTAFAATLPPRPSFSSAEEEQAYYNGLREKAAAAELARYKDDITMRDYTIPTRDGQSVAARTYQKAAAGHNGAVYIHLHGGGFLFGTLDSEDGTCAKMAAETGVLVLNVNYRHTPQIAYPTMCHDVQDAFAWLHAQIRAGGDGSGFGGVDAARVVMGGVSAGAQLTASTAVAQHLRLAGCEALHDLPAPAGLVLMIPPVVNPACYDGIRAELAGGRSSLEQCADAPVIPAWRIEFFMKHKMRDVKPDPADLVLNPGNAPVEKLRGLPPTTFGVCGMDPLRDEGLVWAKRLAEQGVPTNIHVIPGFPHGFSANGPKLSARACKRWDDIMHGGITWALSRPEATGRFEIHDE